VYLANASAGLRPYDRLDEQARRQDRNAINKTSARNPFTVIAQRMKPSLGHALVNQRSRRRQLRAFPSVLDHHQIPTGFDAHADFADAPQVFEIVDYSHSSLLRIKLKN
jgi:hypothetical protein